MKRYPFLVFVLYFCLHSVNGLAQSSASSSMLNYLRDDSGQIVWMQIKTENELLKLRFNQKKLKADLALETLVVQDVNEGSGGYIPFLRTFIESQLATLKEVTFLRQDDPEGMTPEQLVSILESLQKGTIERLRWEYQQPFHRGFNVKKLTEFAAFWQKLKALSFAGTEISNLEALLTKVDISGLEELDIRFCGLLDRELMKIFEVSDKLAKLKTLRIDGNHLRPDKWKEKEMLKFATLNSLSSLTHFGMAHHSVSHRGLVKSLQPIRPTLERLRYLSLYFPGRVFEFSPEKEDPSKQLKLNLSYEYEGLFQGLPDSLLIGRFYSAQNITFTDSSNAFRKGLSAMAVQKNDIEKLLSDKVEKLTLAGPYIATEEVEGILQQNPAILKHVFLVETGISYPRYQQLRSEFAAKGINLHFIYKQVPNYESNFTPTDKIRWQLQPDWLLQPIVPQIPKK